MRQERRPVFVISRALIVIFILLLAGSATASAAPEPYYFLVFSNPVAGHEDEYNKWYNAQHAPDVVAVPGFVSAQRFVKTELPLYRMVDLQVPKYLIVYKIVTDDIEAVMREVYRRLDAGETVLSPVFDQKTSVSYVYKPFRPELKGVGGEPAGAKPGPKELYYQVVFTAFTPGKEDEFNKFYDEHHAPELAALPGFVSAQRMILARPSTASIPASKYLALFKVETSDLAAVKQAATAPGTTSPAFDTASTRGYTFRAIGPVLDGDKVRAARAKAKQPGKQPKP